MTRPVALITGAGSGLGQHFAQTLSARNVNLLLTDIQLSATQNLLPENDHLKYFVLDVRDPENWSKALHTALDTYGSVDYLINFAGIIQPSFIYQAPLSDVDRHIDINTKGTIYGTKIIGEYMKLTGKGHIINIASLAGLAPVPGIALYTASKFAVRGFSLAAAYEYAPFGVSISVVCPDLVNTGMLDLQLNYRDETDLVFSGSGEPLQPADVTAAILNLMNTRKREIAIPASRGLLAKLASVWPALADRLKVQLMKKGAQQKERLRSMKE
jgi:3-oxoacyl-[acyl-carrier protein] reductase